jgi:hypothetical protein
VIVTALAIASTTGGTAIWIASALADKASVLEVEQVRARMRKVEERLSSMDADLLWLRADSSWIKQALWQLVQQRGLAVPPPPVAPPGAP